MPGRAHRSRRLPPLPTCRQSRLTGLFSSSDSCLVFWSGTFEFTLPGHAAQGESTCEQPECVNEEEVAEKPQGEPTPVYQFVMRLADIWAGLL